MLFINSATWFLFFIAILVLLVFFMFWSVYPRKDRRPKKIHRTYEVKEEIKIKVEDRISPKEAVKAVMIQRVEGIKRKNALTIESIVDREKYTKFDDWPPFKRQSLHTLDRETEALRVLKEYDYEITDWKIDIFGDTSLVSFIINYRGTIRNMKFNIHSRVTAFLVKQEENWKLIHEHWSRFPKKAQKE